MKIKQHISLIAIIIGLSISNLFGQLIINDEFTSKGMEPESTFTLEEGAIIPNLRFKNLKSQTFNLHEKMDKLTIIEFWYTGCEACINNKKYLKKFSNQYNINVISISVDEKASTVRKYLEANDIYWDNIHESDAFKGFYQKTLGVPSPIYIIATPEKEIAKVLNDKTSMGRMGVYLQSYFK